MATRLLLISISVKLNLPEPPGTVSSGEPVPPFPTGTDFSGEPITPFPTGTDSPDEPVTPFPTGTDSSDEPVTPFPTGTDSSDDNSDLSETNPEANDDNTSDMDVEENISVADSAVIDSADSEEAVFVLLATSSDRAEVVQYSSSATSGPTEAEIHAAKEAIQVAQTARDNYKSETISSIRSQILQLEASIAEKEVNITSINKKENLEPTRIQMESAEAAIETYKNSKLLEYRQTQSDLQNRIAGLSYTLSGVISKGEQIQSLEKSYRNSVAQKRYETITQIDNSIQSLASELSSAQSNLRLYQITASLYERNLDKDGITTSLSLSTVERVSALLDNLDSLNAQLLDVDTQIQQAQEQIKQGSVKAEKSGVINALATIVSGDVIASGSQIATIIPMNESAFKVQIYVNSADIASIDVGDAIKYNISALPSNQYGTLSGSVLQISNDALVQDGQYSGYFLVEGSIESVELVDKDGNIGTVAIGMQTEAKIITQEKSIFRYLIEKINLF